jgi:hypothetical protein
MGERRIVQLDEADAVVGAGSSLWIMSPAIVHCRGFPGKD